MAEPIGSFFRREREERGLTLEEVGSRMDITHTTVQRYETGKRTLDYSVALQMADAIGISRRKVTEAWITANGGDRSLVAGLDVLDQEIERIVSDEEWELVQAYRGVEPRMKRSFKDLLVSAVEVTGDEPKEELVFGRGPHKPLK